MSRVLIICCLSVLLLACARGGGDVKVDKEELASTNIRLGVGYMQQGRFDDAMVKLQKALEASPNNPKAHSSIALLYEQIGDNENANKHYRTALRLDPGDGATHNNYAVFLCRIGEYQQAEKHFLTAINSRGYRTQAGAYENLGVCALGIPDYEKAETYLRKSLQINPKMPLALLKMASISLEKKRYLSGRAYLQRFLEIAPLDAEGLWIGVQVENMLGDEQAMHDYALQLRKRFPDSDETRLLLDSGLDRQ